jgi:SAM-dependent methyltransferase
MDLLDLINRTKVPPPWSEGEKIPWDDPAFSERMLKEHLSQDHDAASRRFEKIDAHVDWIHRELLSGRATRILDLGCGPGLYASRLGRLGHECVGIDFSPASIAYAAQTAEREDLRCVYRLEDIRTAAYGTGFELVMLIFGEFNAFRPEEAQRILGKAFDALSEDGILLLEVSTFESLKEAGERGASWYSSPGGLFSDRPHLCLTESFWDAGQCVVTTRYFAVEAATGDVACCAENLQAYSDERYCSLLTECGFARVRFYPSLVGTVDETQSHLFVIVAHK